MTESETPYALTIERRDGYLYARVTALQIDAEAFATLLGDLADECRRCDCDKILLYRKVPSMPGVASTFEIVTRMLQLLPGLMVAIVNPYRSNSELLTFAAETAQSRGYDMRVFNDERAAKKWLGIA
ncbi:MAG: hypothetical protein JO053_01695 [Acidobacteria bacterium]|nr:hypothetical protein [Acidobacteriota bacterium]